MLDLDALESLLAEAPHDVPPAVKYAPCLALDTPVLARRHLSACVAHLRRVRPELGLRDALRMERAKIGYFAGDAPYPTRQRIEALYGCVHPFAGPAVDQCCVKRTIQLGAAFETLVRTWDRQPPGSRAFGMYPQPVWDAYTFQTT